MYKILYSIFSIVTAGLLLIGCNPSGDEWDNEPGVAEINRALLYGEWEIYKAKYAPDASMTEWGEKPTYFTFNENGLYEGKGYYGDVKGIYTIQGNVIKVLIDNVTYAEYKVLEQAEDALTVRATFTSTPSKVWMECKRAEYLGPEPGGVINPAVFYSTEANTRAMVGSIYEATARFLNKQLEVESYIYSADRMRLSISSPEIRELWEYGYQAVSRANSLIRSLLEIPDSFLNYPKGQYLNHARTLRDFVLYNMNHLWGGIPLLKEGDDPLVSHSRSDEETVYRFIVDDLLDVEGFPNNRWDAGKGCVSERVINMLLAECSLARKQGPPAKVFADDAAIGDEDVIFTLLHRDTSYGVVKETEIPVYSKQKTNLYIQEAKGETVGLAASWDESFLHAYGYWATLKRLGIAKEKVVCEEYQLRLPIPDYAIMTNPKLEQNEGY